MYDHLQDDIEDLKSISMRDNIIFTFDPENSDYHETKGENSVELVASFIESVLGGHTVTRQLPID